LSVGSNRVNRGGSWNNHPENCRSANRNNNSPGNRNNNLGFRLALARRIVEHVRRTGQSPVPGRCESPSGANPRSTGGVGSPTGEDSARAFSSSEKGCITSEDRNASRPAPGKAPTTSLTRQPRQASDPEDLRPETASNSPSTRAEAAKSCPKKPPAAWRPCPSFRRRPASSRPSSASWRGS